MDPLIRRQVERIHAGSTMAVVAVAGGGAQALEWLLGVPGASRTILEARAPYSSSALADFLGYEPEQAATLETARAIARSAYQRARHLRTSGDPVVGVGCTAALATDRPRKGAHRCFTAAWTERGVRTYGLEFVGRLRDRGAEDAIASMLVLRALAEASRVEFDLPLELEGQEMVVAATEDIGGDLERLLEGGVSTVTVRPDGSMAVDEAVQGGVLPGSFDPLHEGHEGLARAASATLGSEVTFELSAWNVDKPPLEAAEVRERVAQFAGKAPVVVTRAATFYEKARLFPGCTFVIGLDTAVRLVEPGYYGKDDAKIIEALIQIRQSNCQFLVAGRIEDGAFHTLKKVPVPAGFEDMFTSIPEAAFRRDISSTELRMAGRRT